ncbi:MAG: hypothetical protein Q7R96_03310 [Nanoarchaeota archaeon]|nr:hypothetical protein [Nanoarchaeota archaeon]
MTFSKKIHDHSIVTYTNKITLAFAAIDTLFPIEEIASHLEQQYDVARQPLNNENYLLAYRITPFSQIQVYKPQPDLRATLAALAHTEEEAVHTLKTICEACKIEQLEPTEDHPGEKVAEIFKKQLLDKIRNRATDLPLARRIEIASYAAFIVGKYGTGHMRKVLEHYPDAGRVLRF